MLHYSTDIYKREMNRKLTNSLKTLLLLLLRQTSGGEQPIRRESESFLCLIAKVNFIRVHGFIFLINFKSH